MSRDLRESREATVTAVEEERRRLRRDLHDGLGPTLSGVAFATDAARNNETLPLGSFTVLNGGNPNLLPETSQSKSLGLVLNPRFAKGLSINLDYWRTVKANAWIRSMQSRPSAA